LDAGVFPQEIKSRFFRIEIQQAGELRIREIDRDQTLLFPAGEIKITANQMPGGMTKGYKVPYS
jgi:hypothetical protein